MTDQELVPSALRQVGLIIAEHLELGMTDSNETITQLVAVLAPRNGLTRSTD
jgi:hypothetical protein